MTLCLSIHATFLRHAEHLPERKPVRRPDPAESITAATSFALQLLELGEQLGYPRERLIAAVGLPEPDGGASARMPMRDLLHWCEAINRVCKTPSQAGFSQPLPLALPLGIEFAQRVRPATFSVLGYALMTCSTLGEAIELVPHYRQLVFDTGYSETRFQRDGDRAELTWHVLADSPSLPYSPVLAETLLASWYAFGRWIAGTALPLRAVCFQHALSDSAALPLYEAFFACPVHFAASSNSLIFDSALLQRALPQADAVLHLAMREQARAALLRRPSPLKSSPRDTRRTSRDPSTRQCVAESVRQALIPLMPKCEATLERVAQMLNIAPRTLQRRLTAADFSFQGVLDQVRRDLAGIYLADPSLSALDVALLLGYAEQSSFTRAFRQWYGQAPSVWRKLHSNGASSEKGPH